MLRWASTTEAVTFDPNAAYLAPTIAENHQVYEGLVDLNARYELEPSLATVWRLLDPLTWEFELRRDVTFHDGEPFTPEDVVFSLETGRLKRLAVQGLRAADRVSGGRR